MEMGRYRVGNLSFPSQGNRWKWEGRVGKLSFPPQGTEWKWEGIGWGIFHSLHMDYMEMSRKG